MTTVSLSRPGAGGRLRLVERVLLGVACACLVVLALLLLSPVRPGGLPAVSWRSVQPPLLAAVAAYAAGHLLRGVRLAMLLHHPTLGARRVLGVHVLSAALSLLIPFKLGELVRIRLLGSLTGSGVRGLVVVWLERTLDVAVVGLLALVLLADPGADAGRYSALLALSVAFVLVTVCLITVVPENVRSGILYLVRRPAAPGGVRLVRALARLADVLEEAPRLLTRRTPTLLLVTALIWSAEALALGLAVPGLREDTLQLAGGLLSYLSQVSSGAAAIGSEGFSRGLALDGAATTAQLELYRFVVVVPLVLAGAVAAVALSAEHRRRNPVKGRRRW